jgi:broad specificity phosphatase PhoE
MTTQTKIYLVRHGETTFNKLSILSGHLDPPLTEKGKEQARQSGLKLKDIHFDAAYSSDLERAIKTGAIIYGKPVPKANRLASLRERNFGSLEGKPDMYYKEGNERQKTVSHEKSWIYKHVPDMENDHELSLRFIPALESIARKNPGKTILVVAHGGAIRTTLIKLQGFTYDALPAGSFKNGDYAELIYTDDSFKVVQVPGVRI